jgi:hypothetical protein
MDKDDLVSRAALALCEARGEAPDGSQVRFVDGACHSATFFDIAKRDVEIVRASLESSQSELLEALTPSAETKAAYIGEFSFPVELHHPRLGTEVRRIDVPWTTIKEIMSAIRARAERISRHG